MRISFKPRTKEDWRLLLNLAKEIRLAKKTAIAACVDSLKSQREKEADAKQSKSHGA